MKLPVVLPEIKSQRWSCNRCTNCCRELVVHLTPRDRQEIDRQNWGEKIGDLPYVRLHGDWVLNRAPDGACVFLSSQGRCRIHADFGAEAKPLACQLFPFSLHREESSLQATLRFDCPSAGRNQGEGLLAFQSELSRLASAFDESAPLTFAGRPAKGRLTKGRELSHAENEAIIKGLDRWVSNSSVSVSQVLVGIASMAETLSGAKLHRFDEARLIELIGMLFDDLPSAVEDILLSNMLPPTERQWRLFRMTVFAHCEYLRFEQAQRGFLAGLKHRWGQMNRGRRFAAGEGGIPPLLNGAPIVSTASIRSSLEVPMPVDSDDLIARYIRMRLLSGTVYGPGYYGWSVIHGIRALLTATCAVAWLSGYLACARNAIVRDRQDVERAVAMVDRTAGRAPELGARTAMLRGEYLAQDQGISKLIRFLWKIG